MIGIDTNVLVRVLVDDKEATDQCKQARALLIQYDKIFISTVVLTETVWVLRRAYVVSKEQVLKFLKELLLQQSLTFENRSLIERTFEIYSKESFGFSDALILASHEARQCLLYTFDKQLSRHPQASVLC